MISHAPLISRQLSVCSLIRYLFLSQPFRIRDYYKTAAAEMSRKSGHSTHISHKRYRPFMKRMNYFLNIPFAKNAITLYTGFSICFTT